MNLMSIFGEAEMWYIPNKRLASALQQKGTSDQYKKMDPKLREAAIWIYSRYLLVEVKWLPYNSAQRY